MTAPPSTVRRVLLSALAGMLGLVLLGPPTAAELLYRYPLRQVGPPPAPVTTALPPTALAASCVEAGESLPMNSVAIWKWHCPLTLLKTERPGKTVPGERMASRAARVWLGQQASPQRGLRWQLAWGAATVWISRHLTAVEMTRVWISGAWFGRGARGLDAAAEGGPTGPAPEGLTTRGAQPGYPLGEAFRLPSAGRPALVWLRSSMGGPCFAPT